MAFKFANDSDDSPFNEFGLPYLFRSKMTEDTLDLALVSGPFFPPSNGGIDAGCLFGYDVAIGHNRLVIGAPEYNETYRYGAVFVHSVFNAQRLIEIKPTATAGSRFGESVAVGGQRIIVGAPEMYSGNLGSVNCYSLDGEFKWRVDGTVTNGYLGKRVAVWGHYVIASEPGATAGYSGGNSNGAVYVYNIQDGSLIARIISPETAAQTNNRQFGYAIDINHNKIVISDPSMGGNSKGGFYIFDAVGHLQTTVDGTQMSNYNGDNFKGEGIGIGCGRIILGCTRDTSIGHGGYRVFDLNGKEVYYRPLDAPSGTLRYRGFKNIPVAHGMFAVGGFTTGTGHVAIADMTGRVLYDPGAQSSVAADGGYNSVALGDGFFAYGRPYDFNGDGDEGSVMLYKIRTSVLDKMTGNNKQPPMTIFDVRDKVAGYK